MEHLYTLRMFVPTVLYSILGWLWLQTLPGTKRFNAHSRLYESRKQYATRAVPCLGHGRDMKRMIRRLCNDIASAAAYEVRFTMLSLGHHATCDLRNVGKRNSGEAEAQRYVYRGLCSCNTTCFILHSCLYASFYLSTFGYRLDCDHFPYSRIWKRQVKRFPVKDN
jgi:hypothetical protein